MAEQQRISQSRQLGLRLNRPSSNEDTTLSQGYIDTISVIGKAPAFSIKCEFRSSSYVSSVRSTGRPIFRPKSTENGMCAR